MQRLGVMLETFLSNNAPLIEKNDGQFFLKHYFASEDAWSDAPENLIISDTPNGPCCNNE
jgi:hypothetical protein